MRRNQGTPINNQRAPLKDRRLRVVSQSGRIDRWLAHTLIQKLTDRATHRPSASNAADAAWIAHRLGLGVTEGQAELGSDATLWLECNAAELNGVSFSKGCYIGQENTARMNWRQKVNRRLIVVPIDRSNPDRQRIAYPELGLAVDHLRIEDINEDLRPAWLSLQ